MSEIKLTEEERDTIILALPVIFGSTRADRMREVAPAVEAILAARLARVEALADQWERLGEGPFSPDAPITLMNAVKAKQLRAALSPGATT